jgi:hypothetical protein
VPGEYDVQRRHEDHAETMCMDMAGDQPMQITNDGLMWPRRRRRHEVLPVDELVPHPIVRERKKILVGHPDAVLGALHRVVLAHEPIVSPLQRGGQWSTVTVVAESLQFRSVVSAPSLDRSEESAI